ncbi:hypothetical protein D3C81_1697940 [compost metagenome]
MWASDYCTVIGINFSVSIDIFVFKCTGSGSSIFVLRDSGIGHIRIRIDSDDLIAIKSTYCFTRFED